MKNEIILHIGMHKTGSSSIQETLHKHLNNDPSFDYVNLGSANHSKLQFIFKEEGQAYKAKLISSFEKSNSENMLISGEGLIKLSQNDLIKLKNLLSTYFKSIKIVCYVRTPASYMSSAFQQRLKGGGIDSFQIATVYPKYKDKFQKFDLVFNKDNVHFWKFDPKKFPKNDVVLDFCNKLNINIDAKQIIKVNESISKEALSLFYTYRKYFPQYKNKPLNRRLIRELKDIGDTPFKISFSLLKPILEKKKDDIIWMEKRLGDSLEEKSYYYNYETSSEADFLQTAEEMTEPLRALIKKDFLPQEEDINIANLIEALQKQILNNKKPMSKRCIIHVGMPKTGSSSIQKTLATNLDDSDTVYIPFANDNHGAIICTLFGNRQHINRFHKNKTLKELEIYRNKARDLLIKTVRSTNASKYIISGEAILTLNRVQIQELKYFMNDFFDTVEIVAYVRPPYSYISSAFQQLLKTHSSEVTAESAYPNYKRRFGKFYSVFGKDSVHLWKFDPKNFPEGNVVLDFCKKLDINHSDIKTITKNESLSKEAIKILYAYRNSQDGFIDNDKQKDRHIVRRLQDVGKTKFRFSPDLINPILLNNKDDIEWIENKIGEPLLKHIVKKDNDVTSEKELLQLDASELKKLQDIINL